MLPCLLKDPLVMSSSRGERTRSMSVCANKVIPREKRNRSHSVFGEVGIIEDEETEIISDLSDVFSDDCTDISALDVERSSNLVLKHTRGVSIVRRVAEVERMDRLKKEKRNQKRATLVVTSGAMTFMVMAATLVMVSFLMSPTIEEIFGQYIFHPPVNNVWSLFSH